jgi:polyketide biosynthesis acyl carrier protein
MEKEHVYEVVKKVIMEVLPDLNPEMISIEKELKNLGANSVDRMEVVTKSMEELGLKIPLMSFAQVSNIEGLVEVLTENHNFIMKNMVHPQG